MSQKYKKMGKSGMFREYFRLEKLSKQGDPLEKLNSVINWDVFGPVLQKLENKDKKSNTGAKPYPLLMMFKILILQSYYNLSDNQIEYQILDRLSFGRFLGITLNDKVPDENTVSPFSMMDINESTDRLNRMLTCLDQRERSILNMRFGLDGGHPQTLEEISKHIDRTRERVRQIQKRALKKLRLEIARNRTY